jgi:hypothetical protein
MATNKTTETNASVLAYVAAIADEARRTDIAALIKLMQKVSGLKPKMWGPGIVGFGSYHYKYDSGHEGDAPLAGLASRSTAIVLYLNLGEKREALLEKLGRHKIGKGCIYLKKLADADKKVLEEMVKHSITYKYE